MSEFLTGCEYPVFKIYDSATEILIETIQLDLTGSGGLIETVTSPHDTIHRLITGEIAVQTSSDRITFTMDYSDMLNKENGLKIYDIWKYWKEKDMFGNQKNKIILYPRAEILNRFFEVVYTGEGFELGISRGDIQAVNTRFIWQWTTKFLVDINWQDVDDIYNVVLTRFYVENN